MALASQAALLDELMGKNRNACGSDGLKGPHWSDDDVCKSFLCGFCPHDLFVNTKTDLGPCDKTHDERLKENYCKSSRFGKMGYEEDFYRYLCYLLEDVDKRIRRGHERLTVNKSVGSSDAPGTMDKSDKIDSLTRRINELVEQAEKLGTEGKVDHAQGVLKLCEQLRFERSQLEGDTRPGVGQSKELEVCEICGAFRIKDDAPQRVEEHLSGKMHLGYAKIRDFVREYSEKRLMASKERDRESRKPDRGESRYRDRHRSRDRSRDRRSPGHRSRHRQSGSRHRSSHSDRRRRERSRSTSKRRQSRHGHNDNHKLARTTKRNVSPFSAARRPPEGAEDD